MMRHLTRLSWTHGYAAHPGFFHHGYGGGNGIGPTVVSAVVHGLIYGAVFRLLRHLSLTEIVLLAVVVSGALWIWSRDRDRRSW